MTDLSWILDVWASIAIPIEAPETEGTNKGYFPFAVATTCKIDKVYLMVKTAPGSGKTFTVDVNKNGTTIFTTQGNRPSIVDTGTEDESGTPDVTALAKNDKLTVDVDVSTAGTAVADAICIVRVQQAVK